MDTPVPATALSRFPNTQQVTQLIIGDNRLSTTFPAESDLYWFVVVDLSNLEVAAQAAAPSNSQVPSEIAPYADKPGFFLFFIANNQSTKNIPQGPLHAFLTSAGATAGLEDLEQMISQLGTGFVDYFSYVFAGTLDNGDLPGFEVYSLNTFSTLPMQFVPIEIGGQTMYAPSRHTTP